MPTLLPIPIVDKESPESFVPEIAIDTFLFDKKWFLVFTTQDKGSGIDYYEVKETRWSIINIISKWNYAESPYILKDQQLKSCIFVKAFDKAGNEKVVMIHAGYDYNR